MSRISVSDLFLFVDVGVDVVAAAAGEDWVRTCFP
jgi:hypothetical protein